MACPPVALTQEDGLSREAKAGKSWLRGGTVGRYPGRKEPQFPIAGNEKLGLERSRLACFGLFSAACPQCLTLFTVLPADRPVVPLHVPQVDSGETLSTETFPPALPRCPCAWWRGRAWGIL